MSTRAEANQRSHGWRIGSLAGTPVYIARSWPLIVVVIVFVFGPILERPGRDASYGYLLAAGYALLLLVSVLVHEAAHSLAAQVRGHQVSRIVADVWGGHTVYDATRSSPTTTALVAIAGPLSNLALGGLAWVVRQGLTNETATTLLEITAWANVWVGLFNLLPGLPLDGGQIVSAVTWKVTGRRGTGLVVAGWLGRVVAVGSVLWFVVRPAVLGEGFEIGQVALPVVIGVFLFQGASQAIRVGVIQDATAGPAASVLDPAVLLPADMPLLEALDAAEAASGADGTPAWLVATDESGQAYGVLDPEAAEAASAEGGASARLAYVVASQPAEWVVDLPADAVLTDLLRAFSEHSLSMAIVRDEATREVLGVVTADRLNAVIGEELERRRRH